MNKPTNELAVIAEQNGLANNKVQELLSNFGESFAAAKALADSAGVIVVTGEKQTTLMGEARTKRLELKKIRVEVENTRKTMKEASLREGKAIDGMANIIKALIVPVEEHLEKQEKFAEHAAAERKHKRHIERIEKLSPFVDNINVYNLEDMQQADFDVLLKQAEDAFKAKQAAERQAALDRQKEVEAEEKRQQEIVAENARLKKAAEAKEIADAEQRAADKKKQDAINAENEKKLATERKKADDERIKREKLEQEQRDKAAADAKAKAADEERQRQALLAPDKEKLLAFAVQLEAITLPNVADREAGKVLDETADFLARITKNLRKKASEL